MKSIKIAEGVHWVGAYHPDLEVFDELYPTESGTTYNSFLIQGKNKTVLIDTVDEHFFDEFIERIEEVCSVADIDFIVSNHTEHDHSGSIEKMLELNPKIQVIASRSGEKFLQEQINKPINSRSIKDGEQLDLGGRTLQFMVVPFLHWPDTMFTYLVEDEILFSCDAFGAHHCPKDNRIFCDELAADISVDFKIYFDTIIRPFKSNVRSALAKLSDTAIQMVCPSHGPIYRQGIAGLVENYQSWSQEVEATNGKRVLMLEHSPHGTVRAMGDRVTQHLELRDCCVVRLAAITLDEEQFMRELEQCDALVVAAATINRDAGPPVWQALRLLSAVTPKNKLAIVYGAFGWSGEAVNLIEQRLVGQRYKLAGEGVRWQFSPTPEDIKKCLSLADSLVDALSN
ncbi:MAG: hypothetical protein BA874_09275 [Desulfuromonadales bacterium C00003068]|jgi:flavorubredoxin|nr:MAG: hypothetical protein BA874_09275 [Desulfuromonadales bacterium C00003068]